MTTPVEEPECCHPDYHDLGVHAPSRPRED